MVASIVESDHWPLEGMPMFQKRFAVLASALLVSGCYLERHADATSSTSCDANPPLTGEGGSSSTSGTGGREGDGGSTASSSTSGNGGEGGSVGHGGSGGTNGHGGAGGQGGAATGQGGAGGAPEPECFIASQCKDDSCDHYECLEGACNHFPLEIGEMPTCGNTQCGIQSDCAESDTYVITCVEHACVVTGLKP